jgi:hypothetical protein
MKKLISALSLIGALGFVSPAATPSAATPSNDSAQARFRSRLSDRQVQAILTRIRTNAEALVRTIDGVPPRGRVYGNTRQPDDVAYLIEDLTRAAVHLDDHITRQLAVRADVDDVLRRAALVDEAFTRSAQTRAVQTSWNTIRRDIDSLASAYGLTWDWRNPQYSNEPATGVYRQLTGTFTLDVARSDDPQRVIDAALRTTTAANRARITRQLTNRLDPPERVAVDRTDGRIVIASSHGPQFTFDADGQPRTEQGAAGQTITTRAAVYGDQLDVTTTGVANNEFGVSFEPLRDGQELRVTRRIYNDALSRPVSLQSIYRKTSDTPDWNLYDRAARGGSTTRPGSAGTGVLVPDGTVLVARLDQTVNLRATREDDLITLTVRNAPRPELEGATIEGTVLTSPSSNDRSRVSVRFDQIRLRNGRSGEFDGVVEQVTGPDGRPIRFDGEQATIDRSSSGSAVQRGAIGAVIGGIIGALAGGGKGAVIGAAIGGGGAAATVLLDDSGQPELVRGTEFTIRARTNGS